MKIIETINESYRERVHLSHRYTFSYVPLPMACTTFLAVRFLEMDDVLSGASTEGELLQRRDELIQLMSQAELELDNGFQTANTLTMEATPSTNVFDTT